MTVNSFERDFSKDRDSKRNFSKSKKNRHGVAKEKGMTRLFMSIGKSKKVRPGDFVGAIAGETGLSGDIVGSIDIFDKFSFVEVPNKYAQQIIDALNNSNIKGHKVAVEKAQGK